MALRFSVGEDRMTLAVTGKHIDQIERTFGVGVLGASVTFVRVDNLSDDPSVDPATLGFELRASSKENSAELQDALGTASNQAALDAFVDASLDKTETPAPEPVEEE